MVSEGEGREQGPVGRRTLQVVPLGVANGGHGWVDVGALWPRLGRAERDHARQLALVVQLDDLLEQRCAVVLGEEARREERLGELAARNLGP